MTDVLDTDNPPAQDVHTPAVTNVNGGIDLAANEVKVRGDLVGRDKIETHTGGTYIANAAGATIILAASAQAAGGLVALQELMKGSPDVREQAIEFRTDFRAAHEQIDLLGDYKDLHDLLHNLQFQCYDPLMQAAARFPDDERDLNDLSVCVVTLESLVTRLRRVAERPQLPKQDLTWIDEVGLAKSDLDTTLDALDNKLLKKVIWRLSRVLRTEPASINVRLTMAVQLLRLPSLLSALSRIHAQLTSPELDSRQVGQLRSGVEALRQLDQTLNSLVEDHARWQALEVTLRLIGESIGDDLAELEMSWPDVKVKTEQLCLKRDEDWAVALLSNGQRLDEALVASHPGLVQQRFRSFQRRAANRFFDVDKNLKELCDHLRLIGGPLASVLEMIK